MISSICSTPKWYLSICLIVFSACGAGDLTREEALEMLQSHEPLKGPAYERIVLGPDFRQVDFMRTGNWEFADALFRMGYLEHPENEFVLSEKGRGASKEWRHDPNQPNIYHVPVAVPQIEEVTGITKESDVLRQVRFSWRIQLTPIGEAALPQATRDKYRIEEVQDGTATFRLFDDGWRIESP